MSFKSLQSLQDLAVSLVSFQFFLILLINESLHVGETSHCDEYVNYVFSVPFIAHMRTYGQLSLDGDAEEKLNKWLFPGRISESQ